MGLAILALIAGAHTAGLEVLAIGAGGDFAIGVLSRNPDLNIKGLSSGEAHVTGRQHDDAVG